MAIMVRLNHQGTGSTPGDVDSGDGLMRYCAIPNFLSTNRYRREDAVSDQANLSPVRG